MKTFRTLSALLLAGTLCLAACNDETRGTDPVTPADIPSGILENFENQYSGVNRVTWTKKNGYALASFTLPGSNGNTIAWYALGNSQWNMTETEILFTALPEKVKTEFNKSAYAAQPWHTDSEVDVLQRNASETLYIIEVSKKENNIETEVDLYYTEDGILVKTLIDAEADNDHEEYLPQPPAGSIADWLNSNFPGARIIDIDKEYAGTEVEVVHEGLVHEILFDNASAWIQTKTGYEHGNLTLVPTVVLDAARTAYPGATIDEVEKYKTAANGTYYEVELENRFHDDLKIYISESGEVIERPTPGGESSGGSGSGIPVGGDIETFIAKQYPGAVIVEKDYDDGYLEIDIRHNGIEKEIRFNGSNEWIKTTWDILPAGLPEAVKNTLDSRYPGYRTDDIETVETPTQKWYEIELENKTGNTDLKIWIDETGNVTKEIRD